MGSLGRWHVLWFQPFTGKNPWVHDLPFVIKFLICKIWVIITVRVRADSEVLQTVPSNSKHSINIGYYSSKFMYFSRSVMSLCDPVDCSTPGFPVHHQLLELAQTHVHPTISSSVATFSSCLQSFSASGSFPMSQFFASGGQSIGVSADPVLGKNAHLSAHPIVP